MIFTGFADNVMVGRYSTEALASASFVNNVFNVAILACIGFTYGLTPVIGALFARDEKDSIGDELRNSLRVNSIFAVIITAGMTGFYFAIPHLGQPVELIPLIRPYYITFLAGVIPISVFNVFAQWSYGVDDTKTPTVIVLIANGVNILGNYLLIYGIGPFPEMGLTGAGISTLLSRWLCPAVMAAVFFIAKKNDSYRPSFARARLTWSKSRAIVSGSLPLSLQMSFEAGAFSGAAVIAGMLGALELAAFQIIVIVGMLGFCIYYSIGSATSVEVAHAAGVGSRVEMRRMAWAGYQVMLAVMLCSCLMFVFGGKALMGIFTDDSRVLAMSYTLIFPLVLYQLGDATQISFANSLRGTGHVMPMFKIAFVSYIVAGLPSTYLFAIPLGLGIWGIVLSFSVSLFLAGALFLATFLRVTK